MAWPTFPIQGSRLVSEFRGDFNDIIEAMLSAFCGATEPSPKYAGQFWVDTSTTPRLLKQRNTANTAWIVRGRVDADYGGALPLVGGTMEGGIDMGGYPLTNLPLGTGNAAARYSDLASYARLSGATFTAIPVLPASDPTTANQATRKDYVDRKAIAGGAFTAQIALPTAATLAAHALRKGEFDSILGAHAHTGAAGMGPKIGPGGLSPASDNGYVLRTRAGLVEWQPGALVNDLPVLLWNVTSAVAWTTVDLSTYSTYARIALLLLEMRNTTYSGSATRFCNVLLRSFGSANSVTYSDDAIGPSGAARTWRMVVPVPLNSLRFEYSISVSGPSLVFGTPPSTIGYLLGWL